MKDVKNLKGSVILKREELDELLKKEFEKGVQSVTETKKVVQAVVKTNGKTAKLKNTVKEETKDE